MTMGSRPLRVALTLRVVQAEGYIEPRDSISHDWIAKLSQWGWTPLLIPNNLPQAPEYLDAFNPDVLILTGGDDLGQTPERDITETRLLDHALNTDLPVFGVCRGLQLINKRFGGWEGPITGHVAQSHKVTFSPEMGNTYGQTATVNSFHAQGIPVDGLGNGLVEFARDMDGRIEGFMSSNHRLAAVMWHPEREGALQGDRQLIESLVGGKE
ncbi:MAG: gamma-glutamyl-gamma-aminobutyrate hydrolase family protein [Rhodospirillales bacterium]|nr:gamma-glutamyl-gamma-aminobutyrate hydrolase family protein [Rhodospirillales bacterium]